MKYIEVSPEAVVRLERLQQQFAKLAAVIAARRISFRLSKPADA